ncbi:MAG TPA: DegT/DnrJ/EryC1/StrS family aminotransferase [Sedimenticola sp.]|nr:DegT/DnrJ/EryC1/StrS family aminotransferase [Sedimenticola sp.]
MSKPSRLLRLSKASLGPAEHKAVQRPLERAFLGMGSEVRAFEEELATYLGRPVVCVVNGTAALQLALQACGIGRGDEVLVPSLTYVASFQAIAATGATPVACDIREDSCTLDSADAGRRLTARARAVMPVHYAGGVGTLDEVCTFAAEHGLRVVEDAAHAFGSTHRGVPVGGSGDIACFSFDGIKNITSGEGGCVVSDDATVLARVRDARLLGVENDTAARFSSQRSWDFDVTAQGWRYHMSDIMAAIGRVQLGRRAELAARRQALAQQYVEALRGHAEIRPVLQSFDTVVPHIFPVRIIGLRDRDGLRRVLRERGIETGVHYRPNHTLSYFTRPGQAPLPVTERVYAELLTLPLHPDLTATDIGFICDALNAALV